MSFLSLSVLTGHCCICDDRLGALHTTIFYWITRHLRQYITPVPADHRGRLITIFRRHFERGVTRNILLRAFRCVLRLVAHHHADVLAALGTERVDVVHRLARPPTPTRAV